MENYNLPFNIVRKDNQNVGYIDIEGVIGESFWGGETSKDMIKNDLENVKSSNLNKLVVRVNSLGGDVNHALSIRDMLDTMEIPMETQYNGLIASAGTFVGNNTGKSLISENSMWLVHQPALMSFANISEMENNVETLKKIEGIILNTYPEKVDRGILSELMKEQNGKGKWLTAREAVDMGFVDGILQDQEIEEEELEVVNQRLEGYGLPQIIAVADVPEGKSFIQKLKEKFFGTKNEEITDEVSDEEVQKMLDEEYIPQLSLYEEMDTRIKNLEDLIKNLTENKDEESVQDVEEEVDETGTDDVLVDDVEDEVVEEEKPETEVETEESDEIEIDEDEVEPSPELDKLKEIEEILKKMQDENKELKNKVIKMENEPLSNSINSTPKDVVVEDTRSLAERRKEVYKNLINLKK